MKKSNLSLIFSLLAISVCLQAQITITNATFPAAGDSLKTATDLAPAGIVMTAPGGPQVWDFSTLTPSSRQVTVFQPAASGTAFASFPAAELVVIGGVGAETYYDENATAFSVLGLSGAGFAVGLPIPVDLIYAPPLIERRAPVAFFDINQATSNALVAVSTAAIPAGILDSIGIPTGLFDSIRLRLSIQRLEVADAFGTVAIPGGNYEVLRQKQTDYTTSAIDVHTFLGWIDIGSIFSGQLPGIGTDTTITFKFLSNDAEEPIAVVTTDAGGLLAQEVVYKDLGVPSAVGPVLSEKQEVIISPNPVSDIATIALNHMPRNQYTLSLFDANGRRVFSKELTSDRESFSMQALQPGTYLYNVMDGKNNIHASGKLVKITP